MPDPTSTVISATFLSALGIFVIVALVRSLRRSALSSSPAVDPFETIEEQPLEVPYPPNHGNPYTPPARHAAQGSSPVATWFYNRYDLLGLGFVFSVFFGLVWMSVNLPKGKGAELDPETLVSSIFFQFLSALVVAAMVLKRVTPVEWLGLKWARWKQVFLIAPGTVLAMWVIFGGLQLSGYMDWVESFGVETVQDTVKLLQQSRDPAVLGLMAFAAVVAAPLCEEIVFRGYLFSAAKRFTGPWTAGICSGLVFAAAHGSLAALLPLFVFGCVLAYIYEKTGSIWSTIAVHFCFNGATVLVQFGERIFNQNPAS